MDSPKPSNFKTPKRPLPLKGIASNNLLRGLRDKLHRSRLSPSQTSNVSTSSGKWTACDDKSLPSPLKSPRRSPVISESPVSGLRDYSCPESPSREPHLKTLAATKPSNEPHEEIALNQGIRTTSSFRNAKINLAPEENASSSSSATPRPLRETPITFAVDVSGSTSGGTLREETNAILAIVSAFDPPSVALQSLILPWSHMAFRPVTLAGIDSLESRGGTNPAVLLDDHTCKTRLQGADLWFLMTDGLIEDPVVRQFANALPKAGIHGTACVIILFGHADTSPFDCNVSVGMSVFAVAPHCIFLFHDVQTARVFVFQAKGCFSSLLPSQKLFAAFGKSTRWDDLVQINYSDLAGVKVPTATKLSMDVIQLPDGRQFDMTDIYNNCLSEAAKLDLLSDYSALDVILLAAKTRGKDNEIRAWISKSRSLGNSKDPSWLERQDIGAQAKGSLTSLINQALSPNLNGADPNILWQQLRAYNPTLHFFKAQLLDRHFQNWRQFQLSVQENDALFQNVNEAVNEVLDTIQAYQNSPPSPALLKPMSTPPIPRAFGADDYMLENRPAQQRSSPLSPVRTMEPRHYQPVRESNLLFLPGYKGKRAASRRMGSIPGSNYGTCPTCEETDIIHVLLLQRNAEGEETPGFPPTDSRSKHKYPMVLGN
ncbi:hypothetical protein B0H67DRAFT_556948 [Lasiosphaeris hirsuta]|uniref:Uncharacterized protein n=1 Tax=Lasiosphaeris hirsuta TaxID=260670 RepID=A0AA40DP99_9PEZI|nr:hypothetical protein B0H67DRAFT_556948 [Lasiosphaeris hirsuta]